MQRLWLSYSEENEALFCNLCIAYDTSSKQSSSKFKTGFDDWRHVHQRIDEREISQKHQHCAEAFLRFSTGKEISTLVAVGNDTSLLNKHVMRRKLVLDRIVSIIKMIGKRGMSYRGTGGAEKVSSLCDEEVDHGTFLETVLLLTKYDNVMQDHMKNIVKKSLQNKPDKYKHYRANRNTFISKTTVNSIIAVISKLMKQHISNSVRDAGIYSVQIDSTQDITSTDKCSVILRFVTGERVEERLLAVVDSHSATGADLCKLLKEILQKQQIDVSKCISDSTDGASNMSGQYNGFAAFLEKESPGHIHTWCYAHVLNLVLCDVTTTNHESISLFGLVQKLGVFF